MTEISIDHGDLARYLITILDENDEPIDLDEGELTVIARFHPNDAEPVFTKDTSDGIIYAVQSGETKGQADLELTPTDLADVPNAWRTLVFDVKFLRDGDEAPQTPIRYALLRVIPSLAEPQVS